MNEFNLDQRKLESLLASIEDGELKLPCFQRSYKWKPSRVKKLLDSIQKNHPAGSLLFLECDSKKRLIMHEPFKYTEKNDVVPEYLVLDGQQRLTSFFCAFYNKGTKSYYLDLMKLFRETKEQSGGDLVDFESLIVVKNKDFFPDQYLANHLLPFSFLRNKEIMREKLVSYKQNLRNEGIDQHFINFLDSKLESYLDAFFDYRFPIIILPKKLSLDAVCKVFQTINTTGLKLSAFDICVAKFMTLDKNLKEMIKKAKSQYDNIGPILENDETVVLQVIALLANKSPKKNKLADILDENDISLWDKAIEGLSIASNLLVNFGTGCNKDLSLLPYQPVFPVIAAFLVDRDFKNQSVPVQSNISEKLKKWFYTTALTLRYIEGTENKMKDDYNQLKRWILNGVEPDYMANGISWNNSRIINLNKTGAIGKAILCAINFNKPSDFYTDAHVGLGLNIVNSQLHHIFPDAQYSTEYNGLVNSVFNFTFLTAESNNYIKNKRTSQYIPEIINERGIIESAFKSLLQTHFIDEIGFENLKQERLEEFLGQRASIIRKFFSETLALNIKVDETTQNLEDMNIDDDFDLSEEQIEA